MAVVNVDEMFEPGRILLTEALGNRAAIIDIRGDKPVVTD